MHEMSSGYIKRTGASLAAGAVAWILAVLLICSLLLPSGPVQAGDEPAVTDSTSQEATTSEPTIEPTTVEPTTITTEPTTTEPTTQPGTTPTVNPGGAIHVVQAGESLNSIAGRYGVNVAALAWINNLDQNAIIHPGDRLRIPGSNVTAPASTSSPTTSSTTETRETEEQLTPLRDISLYTTEELYLRSGPAVTAKLLRTIPAAAEVTAHGYYAGNGWYHVTYRGTTGFVNGNYLEATPAESEETTTEETEPVSRFFTTADGGRLEGTVLDMPSQDLRPEGFVLRRRTTADGTIPTWFNSDTGQTLLYLETEEGEGWWIYDLLDNGIYPYFEPIMFETADERFVVLPIDGDVTIPEDYTFEIYAFAGQETSSLLSPDEERIVQVLNADSSRGTYEIEETDNGEYVFAVWAPDGGEPTEPATETSSTVEATERPPTGESSPDDPRVGFLNRLAAISFRPILLAAGLIIATLIVLIILLRRRENRIAQAYTQTEEAAAAPIEGAVDEPDGDESDELDAEESDEAVDTETVEAAVANGSTISETAASLQDLAAEDELAVLTAEQDLFHDQVPQHVSAAEQAADRLEEDAPEPAPPHIRPVQLDRDDYGRLEDDRPQEPSAEDD